LRFAPGRASTNEACAWGLSRRRAIDHLILTHLILTLLALADKASVRKGKKTPDKFPRWPALAALAMLAGCAAREPRQYAPANAEPVAQAAPAAESGAGQESDFTGLWEGTSTSACLPLQPDASRCNAVQKITLQLFQEGSRLTGHYTCAPGNMVCRDSNTTGTIADGKVRASGVDWRVMLPDGSSCLFNGRPSQGNTAARKLTGSYFCMQGGGYIEKGRFQVERSY
jgi:hypothetical protein